MADLERHRAETRFCWAGGLAADSVFYYRIQSPVTMIEFDHHWGVVLDNPRPERFHIHTTVRTPNGNDFGIDLLRLHYLRSDHHGHAAAGAEGHRHAPAHDHDHPHDHPHDHQHDHQHDHDHPHDHDHARGHGHDGAMPAGGLAHRRG
jgi:hypothetical protein